MTKPYLCVYHSNCADGFGAAWCVRHALGEENVEFYPGVYQNDPPDVTGRDVIFVDFCYKRDVMLGLLEKAHCIFLLDHHKTAMEDMVGVGTKFGTDSRDVEFLQSVHAGTYDRRSEHPRLYLYRLFDMERSGAGIAWDFFHPHEQRPQLIDFIEDRDLWRFRYSETRAIQANLFSYPYDFAVWDQLMDMGPLEMKQFRQEGEALERKHHKDIAELVTVVTRPMKIGGYTVPVANLPYTMTSDAGHLLCGQRTIFGKPAVLPEDDSKFPSAHKFAACFWDTPEGRVFSLRSQDDGADVGEIAKLYGGGGHKHAAGFRVPFDQLEQFEP